jgi:hypothetical protein
MLGGTLQDIDIAIPQPLFSISGLVFQELCELAVHKAASSMPLQRGIRACTPFFWSVLFQDLLHVMSHHS